jgi:cobaltochelatase CobN
MMNLDADMLMDSPEKVSDGITNVMILENVDEIGRQLFIKWESLEYSYDVIDNIIKETAEENHLNSEKSDKLKRTLTFVHDNIYPALMKTTDEIESFRKAVNGKFVLKGPSGSPSRGNAYILPTGRNFYTIDPCEVPSRASWETGKRLANQLIDVHREETGEFPENIAIVVYAGETMKTGGDDIAEILYLYGIKPVWLGETDRVIGLEVMSMEELQRPRIDAVLRITGLFRDTFPNLIELVDEAVNMVAVLDESSDVNFIKKHIESDLDKFISEGMNREQAYERAAMRIFGCPPGTYGAGVDSLITSKKWENSDNLGTAYINWSGHGYSGKVHGEKMQDLFAHRLSTVDVTVKNISSCESDMLDSDDFYNYHGGLISAVKKQRGELPSSYSTNAADINHVTTKNIHKETARIMRARINNPKWIEGLKKHGFKGAQGFSEMVDIVFGWDATSDVIDDYMYDMIFETYINDSELREWIKSENPYALHSMSERLLEAVQRGMWEADNDKSEKLQQIYLETEGMLEEN